MLDRITGMQVFSRAAQTGSLSAAARQLSISPGMATKHLDTLENAWACAYVIGAHAN
jgi:DNA-binding transcriptional LysR family regulator